MRRILKEALAKERHYYTKQLCSLGVYSPDMTKNMTISDLKKSIISFSTKQIAIFNIPYHVRCHMKGSFLCV